MGMGRLWRKARLGFGAGMLLLLGGCADIHCFSATDKGACYAAYNQHQACEAENRDLIQHIGDRPVQSCRREPRETCSRGRDGNRRCYTSYGPETCTTRWEPIYDRRVFNREVTACMRYTGHGAYVGRF